LLSVMELDGNDNVNDDNNMAEEIPGAGTDFGGDGEKGKRRGRPQGISDECLLSTRNFLAWLFGNTWGEVGWNLRRIKTAEDVRSALGGWEQYRDGQPVIYSLLRPSGRSTKAAKLSDMTRRRNQLSEMLAEARQDQRRRQDSLDTASRILTANLPPDQQDLVTEQRLVRAMALEDAKAKYLSLQEESNDLVEDIKDCHAYFARAELLDFCKHGRYALNPVNLANALAGLPYIGYRHSINRCRQWNCDEPGGPYQVFKVLCKVIASRRRGIDLIRHAKQWLRVALVRRKGHSDSNAINELCRNWYYLQRSITPVVSAKPHPRALPYRLTSEYFKRLGNRSSVDLLFEEDEQIVP
jgi:hypothetical protein